MLTADRTGQQPDLVTTVPSNEPEQSAFLYIVPSMWAGSLIRCSPASI
jgi:hypothetical protein